MTVGKHTRIAWVKTLKVGDEVCYKEGGNLNKYYKVVSVSKITPTGILKMSDETSFSPGGLLRGGNRWVELEEYTKEIKGSIEHKNILSKVEHLLYRPKLKDLTTEQLTTIKEILESVQNAN